MASLLRFDFGLGETADAPRYEVERFAAAEIAPFPTGRLLRDAKLYEIGAGTSDVRRMLIGRELFGETA